MKKLLGKFAVLGMIVLLVVMIGESSGKFKDPYQRRYYTRWDQFYAFTETDTIDVVYVGNSHGETGINTPLLAKRLGCNCFNMCHSNSTIYDAYYNLEEVLERTHPKLVIFETFAIFNNDVRKALPEYKLYGEYTIFSARKNRWLKLKSTPALFNLSEWIFAWSDVIRNHNLLWLPHANSDVPDADFGDVRAMGGHLDDSLLRLYEKDSPIHGENHVVGDETYKYVQKIADLCAEKGVLLLLYTVPMYYKHFANYSIYKRNISGHLPAHLPWFDLQADYDTLLFDSTCFENTYEQNQHATYHGSEVFAEKLAVFIRDSVGIKLPQRDISRYLQTIE